MAFLENKDQLDQKSGRKEEEEAPRRLSFFEFVDQEIEDMKGQGMRESNPAPYKVIPRFRKSWNLGL